MTFPSDPDAEAELQHESRSPHKTMSEEAWFERLGPERYRVLRGKGTERPFTGQYNLHWQAGVYTCGGCGQELFPSTAKFDSRCGWPSFDRAAAGDRIREILDKSHGMIRTEVVCSQCGSHLGHVFPDGPTETGLRYCINSVSLDFAPSDASQGTTGQESRD